MRPLRSRGGRLALVTLFAVGCSKPVSGLRLATDPDAKAACERTADAFAHADEHCGFGDYRGSYDAFVAAAANGDCATIKQVRDPRALPVCFAKLPGAEAGAPDGGPDGGVDAGTPMTCDDLAAGKLDVTCRSQLIHE